MPQDSFWYKYSGTTTLPLTHSAFGGSDGGPVRYIKAYIIVNYAGGTLPTYWGGLMIRRYAPWRDSGVVGFNGKVQILGGSPGSGKVLTSDPLGIGSWVDPNLLITETDPQVGVNSTNYLSKWDGSALVTSQIFDNGTNIGIGTASPSSRLDF